ncbi:MAG: hypothetical protein BHW65_09125 [Verrucomicrobia bacterium CAG:312_58_20]|nr:MAG: hypothetical protein BHW65_09125 [Verrucomicrobia bacterium CAG:312_58_20]
MARGNAQEKAAAETRLKRASGAAYSTAIFCFGARQNGVQASIKKQPKARGVIASGSGGFPNRA